ncbi:MAG: hypothetical protein KGI79_00415 [Patescibacteria group bacterium]|nr:hypothetical protein [Patescibacteria group bacterium]MDE2116329.1 hypothetical protein [Patescibacteria group bacterium]
MNIFSDLASFAINIAIPQTARWLIFFAVVWIPIVIFEYAWGVWVRYVRTAWIGKQEKILLEIKLPQETIKSPLAMELVLTGLYQTGGEGTPLDRYWEGKVRPWFSLELASIDGEIHFYIWTFKSQRAIVESNIYAQYPGVEIHEVPDYTEAVFFDPEKYELAGCRFEATGPDPLPIKTYVDYGLDKDPKEEYKVDPMAPLIEFMGSLKKGHQAWVQIIVRAHTQEKTPLNNKYPDKWKEEAKELIQKVIDEAAVEDEEGNKVPNLAKLTKGAQEKIAAIERSVSKLAFDAGIRIVYIAPKDIFDKGNGGGLTGSFKQFNAPHMNGFKPEEGMSFDYKWQDWKGHKLLGRKIEHFRAYCERGYFHYPFMRKWTVLNTEELATLYHFPGSAVKTPTLKRIPSKSADAPSNLPV